MFFYGSYYRPENHARQPRQQYGELPEYERARNEGFGKVTVTPISSRAAERQLPRLEARGHQRLCSARTRRRQPERATKPSRRSAPRDGSWVINSRSVLTFKYTHFVNPYAGHAGQHRQRRRQHRARHAARHQRARYAGQLRRSRPSIAGQTAYNAFVQPLIDRYGYVANGVRVGGGTVGYGSQFDNDDFFRDAGQVAYNLTLRRCGCARPARRLSAVRRLRRPDAQLERLGRDHRTWRPARTSLAGTPIFFPTRIQQQTPARRRRSTRSTARRAFEFNDTIRWKRLDLQRRRARQPRHALRPGPARGRRRAVRLRRGAGQQVQDATTSPSAR